MILHDFHIYSTFVLHFWPPAHIFHILLHIVSTCFPHYFYILNYLLKLSLSRGLCRFNTCRHPARSFIMACQCLHSLLVGIVVFVTRVEFRDHQSAQAQGPNFLLNAGICLPRTPKIYKNRRKIDKTHTKTIQSRLRRGWGALRAPHVWFLFAFY